jgi:hypothetical protein
MKKLMTLLGYDAKLYGEHSGKRGEATAAANNGATDKQLKRLGGWRSDAMPAKYVDLSISSRLSMSMSMSLADGVGTIGIREVLEGQDKADGGYHSNEASSNPAGRIWQSGAVFFMLTCVETDL